MSGIVSRFAPSPTGALHEGHGFSALMAHDAARADGGRFLLRIEDLDRGRSRAEHVGRIFEDLRWLGIGWDEAPLFQSQRGAAYAEALARLDDLGVTYPCFCTRKDIADAGGAPHGPDGPLYPGTCRGMPEGEAAARRSAEPFAIRLDAARAAKRVGALTFETNGERRAADPLLLGDVVLARKDAAAAYHLAATVDDAHQGVTLVVRGDDLLASTHVHRVLQGLLELPEPRYRHHRLIRDETGARLAKRTGAPALADLRLAGEDGAEVAARLRGLALPR